LQALNVFLVLLLNLGNDWLRVGVLALGNFRKNGGGGGHRGGGDKLSSIHDGGRIKEGVRWCPAELELGSRRG